MSPSVLITGARSPAALDIARALREAGAEPHLADCATARIARWSNAPAAVHRYAPPASDAGAFQRDILAIVERTGATAIVPTCEEAFHLAAPGLRAAIGSRLVAPDLGTLHRLHRKDAFAALARDLGLDAPETHLLSGRPSLEAFRGKEAEWVFKPCYSRFGSRALVGPSSVDDVPIEGGGPWIAQSRAKGEEACLYAFARDGKVVAFSAYRADWQMPGGASFAFAPLDEARSGRMKAIAETLTEGLRVTGQIACDCIFGEDGRCWLLECNPRSTSGVHLCAPEVAAAILGRDPGRPDPRRRHNLPMMLSYGIAAALRSRSFRRLAGSLLEGFDVVGRPGDRLPVLGAVADAAGFALAARRARSTITTATTADIEWNGEDLP